jgi:hypothetical protein
VSRHPLLAAVLAFALIAGVRGTDAPPTRIAVAVNRPGAAIPSTLFGVFFEDINFAASASLDQASHEVIVKLVNPGGESHAVSLSLDGTSAVDARAITLTGDPDAENSIVAPTSVVPSNGVAACDERQLHAAVAFVGRGAHADQLESASARTIMKGPRLRKGVPACACLRVSL